MRRIEGTEGQWFADAISENPDAWVAISEADAEYCLNVLPPIYFPGGFAVSEPARHTGGGVPVYTCVVRVGGKPYARDLTIAEAIEAAPGGGS